MASTPESKVKRQIDALLMLHGAYRVMPVSNGMGAHGIPDFLVCLNGRFIGIEAKAGKGKPTALQLSNLRRIYEAGGTALVINEHNLQHLGGWLSVVKMGGRAFTNIEQYEQPAEPETDGPRKRANTRSADRATQEKRV